MTDKIIISFMASDKLAADINTVLINGGYNNRSDAVRSMVRKGLEVETCQERQK